MTARLLRSMATIAAAWLLGAGMANAQAPVLAAPTVSGGNVSFTWSATAGATGYRLDAGFGSGAYVFQLPLGNVTAATAPIPADGTFYVRIVAQGPGGEAPSNEVSFTFPAPPAVPTNFVLARNGTGFVASWAPGTNGSAVDSYAVQIGVAPGTTAFSFPSSTTGWGYPAGVPVGTYYARVVGVTRSGAVSAASNEVMVTMPPGGACDPATSDFSAGAASGLIFVNRTAIPGVATFVSAAINGSLAASNLPIAGGASLGFVGTPSGGSTPPAGNYIMQARTVFACGSETTSTVAFANDGSPGVGPRTPNPAAGQLLPVPGYLLSVVNRVANRRPDLLRASCAEHGGNNRYLYEVIRELRTIDTRWGLNIKRGYQGLSQDVVAYNRGPVQDEGATTGPNTDTRNVSAFDIIAGHCGPNPSPWVSDVTAVTLEQRTRLVWTLAPYVNAGYKP